LQTLLTGKQNLLKNYASELSLWKKRHRKRLRGKTP